MNAEGVDGICSVMKSPKKRHCPEARVKCVVKLFRGTNRGGKFHKTDATARCRPDRVSNGKVVYVRRECGARKLLERGLPKKVKLPHP